MLRLTAAVALLLAACGGTVAPPPPPPATGLLLAGGDEASFVPWRSGAEAVLVEGAQGGFHVWMRYRAPAQSMSRVVAVHRSARRQGDGKLVLNMEAGVPPGREAPGSTWEPTTPTPMFMCPSPIGLSVIDQPIVFRIELLDEAGSAFDGGEVTLVPRCPDSSRAFCLQICTG